MSDDLLILCADDVSRSLGDDMQGVVEAVKHGYLDLHHDRAVMPPSPFLRFQEGKPERVIGLPAYLRGDRPIAGIKWIASFPQNVKRGIDRASAVIVVNNLETGRPDIVMEGAIISATRTAASAALAARELHPGPSKAGVIGCGPIAWQTLRYLGTVERLGDELQLFDLDESRAVAMGEKAVEKGLVKRFSLASSSQALMEDCPLSVLATSAIVPHLEPRLGADHTVLHLSLRDLTVPTILGASNVTDSIEHVLQAATSLDLAQQETGNHDFVHGSLAQVLTGEVAGRPPGKPLIFSPFGMGVLDLAVAGPVIARCIEAGRGVRVPDFFGSAWAS